MSKTYDRRVLGVPGMELLSVSESRFKLAGISASLILPLEKGHAGARALVPYLLRSSCSVFGSSLELHRRLAMMYGAELSVGVQRLGDMQQITMTVTFIDDRYTIGGEKLSGECARLLCDVLLRPNTENGAFADADVEREKRLLIEQIEAERNDKLGYSIEQCISTAAAGEPHGTDPKGTPDELAALDGRQLYAAWRELIETARIDIVAVGMLDIGGIADMFERGFSEVQRRPAVLPPHTVIAEGSARSETEFAPVTQTNLVELLRFSPDIDQYSAKLMSVCLGGSVSSLFFRHIREELSLCYYCSCGYARSKHYLLIYSGLMDESLEKAKEEINAQIKLVADGGLTGDDISAAKLSITDSYRQVYDSVGALMSWYTARVLEDAPDTPEQTALRINAVDADSIARAARALSPDMIFALRPSEQSGEDGEHE